MMKRTRIFGKWVKLIQSIPHKDTCTTLGLCSFFPQNKYTYTQKSYCNETSSRLVFPIPLGLIPKSSYCEASGPASEWTMPPSHPENLEAHLHTSLYGGVYCHW